MATKLSPRGLRAAVMVLFGIIVVAAAVACGGDEDSAGRTAPDVTAGPATSEAGTSGAPAATSDTSDAPALDAEQILYANLTAEPATLDPQRASDQVSLTVLRSIYSGLLRLDPDDRLVPDLAEEIPSVENGGISEDGLTYTFRLREGLTWSDGSPLAAQAFVDAARRLFEPGAANPYTEFYRIIAAEGPDGDANLAVEQAIASGDEDIDLAPLQRAVVEGLRVEATDDRTVVYHLNRRSPVFLLLASLWPLYPVRGDLVEKHGEAWTEAGTLVSNGPFVLDEWDHGQRLRLTRNPRWHGDHAGLEAVEFDMIEDGAVAFLAYQNDEIDITLLGPTQLVQVRNDAALRAQFRGYAQLRTLGVYFNVEDPLFADARVRQAFAGAVDRVEYAGAVLEGNALPAYGWIPPGMPGHDDEVGRQFKDATQRSASLLADAGAGDAEVTLLVPEAPTSILTAEWLKEQWESSLGVTVNVDVREIASYVSARTSGEFQAVIGGWGADYPDPQNWLPPFRTGSPLNFGHYSNPDFDRLIDEADREVDYERRLELYVEAQRILVDDVGVMPLNYPIRASLVKPWVQGLQPSPREGVLPGDLFLDRVFISGRP